IWPGSSGKQHEYPRAPSSSGDRTLTGRFGVDQGSLKDGERRRKCLPPVNPGRLRRSGPPARTIGVYWMGRLANLLHSVVDKAMRPVIMGLLKGRPRYAQKDSTHSPHAESPYLSAVRDRDAPDFIPSERV